MVAQIYTFIKIHWIVTKKKGKNFFYTFIPRVSMTYSWAPREKLFARQFIER